jgi:crotonobetainyl-CoA:carnitine CoA-transferase CaiB-like acyl-CoA transferase
MRTMGIPDADGTTAFYKLANRNKTVVRLDLKDDRGRRLFEQLVTAADVLIEGYRPGVMDRLGFGEAALAALNPRLIYCSLSGYGQTGPYATKAGHDMTYMALSGGLAASGTAERPVMTYPPLADHAGAMSAVIAVLAALLKRAGSGKGARLDVSLAEAALSWMGGVLTAGRRWGDEGREQGMINGGAAYYHIYRTADGRFLAVAPIEEKFWAGLCNALGRPDLIPRQHDPLPQEALTAELQSIFATRGRDDWMIILDPADCCVAPVLEPSEVPDHPQVISRRLVERGQQDDLIEVLLPMLIDGARAKTRRPLAEDSAEAVAAGWRAK